MGRLRVGWGLQRLPAGRPGLGARPSACDQRVVANYDGNWTYDTGTKGPYRRQAVAVGTFAPNAFGLYDMHGNVHEWGSDCWNDTHDGASSDSQARISGDCTRRVSRGGAWNEQPFFLRSALRRRGAASSRAPFIGFRVARTL